MLLQSFTTRANKVFCSALVLTTAYVGAQEQPIDQKPTTSSEEQEEAQRLPAGTRSLSSLDSMENETIRSRNLEDKPQETAKNSESEEKVVARSIPVRLNAQEEKEESVGAARSLEKKEDEKARGIAKGYYYSSHGGAFCHPKKVDLFLGQLTLHDGSVWSVSFGDTYKTTNWLKSDDLVIIPNGPFSFYKYRIVNQDTLVSVDANIILTPYIGGYATYSIIAIDYILGNVWLNDGTVWEMTPFDNYILKSWLPGDIVLIGINDDYLHDLRPNVLINALTTTYSRGICLY